MAKIRSMPGLNLRQFIILGCPIYLKKTSHYSCTAGRSNKRSKESLVSGGGGSSSDKKGAGGKVGSGSSLSSQLAGSNSATAAAAAAANTAYELVQASHALQAVQVKYKVINAHH